jgi:hypothetical protein
MVKSGPEVALVGIASSLSCDRKRLTGKAGGPDLSVRRPVGKVKRPRPPHNPGEEVTLSMSSQVSGLNNDN